QEVLAALFLAGVRNVQPRPHVGYKFHAVMVVNSAHLASLASPDEDRWLPVFWALDYFKNAQRREQAQGDWTLRPVDESALPPAGKAHAASVEALERWDEPAADTAVASLARSEGGHEIYEIFFRYGARDFRSIGHKAIYVANSYRTLQAIGWRHAEPVLRSLAYALLAHEGQEPSPDSRADRSWFHNRELVKKIRAEWPAGRADPAVPRAMLATLREGSPEAAAGQVV